MTTTPHKFLVLNAFSNNSTPYTGNPAAVFPFADEIPEENLQLIARQLNLVETVFIYKPVSINDPYDFKLRYFMPEKELPIAGHPSIAAWTALSELGIINPNDKSSYRQSNQAGVQEIRFDNRSQVFMKQITPKFTAIIDDTSTVAKVFGLATADINTEHPIIGIDIGLGHLIFGVKNLATLNKVKNNVEELLNLCKTFGLREAQIFTFEGQDIYTRNICPRLGLEDPACGNGNAALGTYFHKFNVLKSEDFSISVSQGQIVNMPAVINVESKRNNNGENEIWIGGSCVKMVEGEFFIDESLDANYKKMSLDTERENKALEWAEGVLKED